MQGVRRARDPIEHVRRLLLDNGVADADGLKRIEKEVRKQASRPPFFVLLMPCVAASAISAYLQATGPVAAVVDSRIPETVLR